MKKLNKILTLCVLSMMPYSHAPSNKGVAIGIGSGVAVIGAILCFIPGCQLIGGILAASGGGTVIKNVTSPDDEVHISVGYNSEIVGAINSLEKK